MELPPEHRLHCVPRVSAIRGDFLSNHSICGGGRGEGGGGRFNKQVVMQDEEQRMPFQWLFASVSE